MDVHLWHQEDVEIVPMDREHIESIARLEQECFSQPWSYDSLREELSNPLAVFRVALLEGQVVGYVGTTGSSTGNHLHLEVRDNYTRVDPESKFPSLSLTHPW